LAELADTITKSGQNPEVKVIVLQSEGEKTFCAGASFDEKVHGHWSRQLGTEPLVTLFVRG
jgi:enoyl-CoA hydratase/carnithine racemase